MSRWTAHRAVWLLAVIVSAVIGGTAYSGVVQAARTIDAPTIRIFLPVVMKDYPPVLYGRVTQNGQAAVGVPVSLRFYNGSAWSTAASTMTDAAGLYRFANVPALASLQKYQVLYENTSQTSGRLAWWTTRELTSYNGGTLEFSNFDIADINLAAPANDATIGLPVGFTWTPRPASATDTYALRLYDPADFNPAYTTANLGYVGAYTLGSMPSSFSLSTTYRWDVLARSPDGGTGASRLSRVIRVTAGIYGRVRQSGINAGGVLVQLRFFNGTAWSTKASATTNNDGLYVFSGMPALSAGQQYYVRYENAGQIDGRLFMWSTRSLTAYAAGSNVDLGTFDIADIALNSPAGGSVLGLPVTFQWTRRPATTGDSYLFHLFDPADYQPHWCGPLVGYSDRYTLAALPAGFGANTQHAWEVVVSSPDGGSGVSRMARLITFSNTGFAAARAELASGDWPFAEPLPPRPPESFEGR